ncbi:MAG: type I secretion protein, partial [Betaproteobacteria bacterium]|nr:type I secretion protein [Betaproteobacteria bacterium]
MAPVGSTVVNPLTTLIQQYINSKGVSAAQAETAIEAMMVLPNVDMGNYDPLAVADPVDATALAVQKAAAQLAVLMTLADEFSAGSATVMMQSLIDLIDAGQTVNLASTATLNAINAGAGGLLNATQIATVAAGTSAVAQTTTLASAEANSVSQLQQQILDGINDAAVLSSAAQVLDETDAPLATGGTLTISDVDSPVAFVAQTGTAGTNGTFSVDAAGNWTYTANSAFDNLNVGESVSDTFTVAAADGTTTSVQVTINGTNDAAILSSAVAALDETNAALSTGGQLTIGDVDSPATFVAQTGTAGTNGTFSVDAAGAWTYTANSAFDNLSVGGSVSDSFTVASADGTTTSVQVTISGTNDAAILSAAVVALDETNAALSTSGQLTISDVDSPAAFVAQTGTVGTNGSFSVDATGAWTYTANSAFENLNVGDSVSDTFTVASADGTTTSVQVTINGTNDAAILSAAVAALDETDAA